MVLPQLFMGEDEAAAAAASASSGTAGAGAAATASSNNASFLQQQIYDCKLATKS
jgi:hypothetical protein